MTAISRPRRILAAIIILATAGFQVVGLARYTHRLPDDWVGLSLYAATIVGLLVVAGLIATGRKNCEG
jgi:hypothetical protein